LDAALPEDAGRAVEPGAADVTADVAALEPAELAPLVDAEAGVVPLAEPDALPEAEPDALPEVSEFLPTQLVDAVNVRGLGLQIRRRPVPNTYIRLAR
jgi:hypothetical protein